MGTILNDCLNVDRSIIWPKVSNFARIYRQEQRSLGDHLGNKRNQFHQGAIVELICADLGNWLERSASELMNLSFL